MKRVVVGLFAVLTVLANCYDPNRPPPCRPGSVDWPRCDDPTLAPKLGASLIYPGRSIASISITDSTVAGRALLTAASVAAQNTLLGQPVVIYDNTLSSATSWTSPTWTAETYRQVEIILIGSLSGLAYTRFQFNADSTTDYVDIGLNTRADTTLGGDSANDGTNGFSRVGVGITAGAVFYNRIVVNPRVTGGPRTGEGFSVSGSAGGATTDQITRQTGIVWVNAATAVTFVTLGWGGVQTFTGSVLMRGYY